MVVQRTELRQITVATYHQVWWPAHDDLVHAGERVPVWDGVRGRSSTRIPANGCPRSMRRVRS